MGLELKLPPFPRKGNFLTTKRKRKEKTIPVFINTSFFFGIPERPGPNFYKHATYLRYYGNYSHFPFFALPRGMD